MSEHFNGLTPAEAELLALLAEECDEIVQAIGKALRHGMENYNPLGDHSVSNRDGIEKEIGDLNAVCARLVVAKMIRPANIVKHSNAKEAKLAKWTHHQPDSQLGSAA